MERKPVTAYPELEKELGRQIREAAIDYDSFRQRLRICDLGTCRATCCHDGVILTEEEVGGIDGALKRGKDRLAGYGWKHGEWRTLQGGRNRSVTLETNDLPEGYPSHFPQTRCVFLDAGHRCVLQRLAMDEARHPWFWKPISCWMHPLVLKPGQRGGRPELTLPSPGNDPGAKPGYPGFSACTPCGIEAANGRPAWEALGAELDLLGRIGGRDLKEEIVAAVAE